MKWNLPRYAAAVLDGLNLIHPSEDLACLSEREWELALSFADRTQLTLSLGARCGQLLPPPVRRRLEHNYADNARRMERLQREYDELARGLERAKAHYVVLKGFTQFPLFTSNLNTRVQYDLDLFCPRGSLERAYDVARALGYESLLRSRDPTDHLPRMARKSGWQWRGNYFDPDIPIAIELHFQLWDAETEAFGPDGLGEFWERRTTCRAFGGRAPVFAPADALGYSALHLLRHVLRGSAQPFHVYELACFLNRNADDKILWQSWREWHPASLRRLEAISFQLAAAWFGGKLSDAAQAEIDGLPGTVKAWFERYATSPVEQLFRPNKDELWLHLCLLASWSAAAGVLRRRLLPGRLPGHVDSIYVPDAQMTAKLRLRKWYRYAKFLRSRLAFHLWAHVRTARRGLGWLWIFWVRRRADSRSQYKEVKGKDSPISEQVAR